MLQRVTKLGAVAVASALLLTGCTPPMPPEVQAALAEQVYTCVDGDVTTNFPSSMADATTAIAESLSANCSGMSLQPAVDAASADLVVGFDPAACNAYNTVPYALDAGVVVGLLPEASGLVLSPKTIQGIFDGSITTWDDPAITTDNADTPVGSGEISVFQDTDANALSAFSNWYKQLTGKAFKSSLKSVPNLSAASLAELPDNTVALIPFSVFTEFSVTAMTIPYAASVMVDAKANPAGSVADIAGVASAGTQLVAKSAATGVTVTMNYNNKPIAPEGSDVAPDPYGAIYPVSLLQCGTDTKTKRAAARFMLRQDSQGTLTTFVPLPEAVRAEALVSVSKGLKVKLPKVPNQ